MRYPLVLALTALASAATVLSAATVKAPSFTGTWVPDAKASTHVRQKKELKNPGGKVVPPAPPENVVEDLPTLRIDQTPADLTIEMLQSDGASLATTRLTTDGKENLNPRGGGHYTHRSTSKWEGSVLVTTWALARGETVLVSGVDRMERTDRKTLVVTTTTEDERSTSKSVTVYHPGKI